MTVIFGTHQLLKHAGYFSQLTGETKKKHFIIKLGCMKV